MRKKLFSILALLCLTVTSAWADADVTWNSSNVSDIRFWGGAPDGYDSYTKEGITLRGNAEGCDAEWADFGNGPGIMFAMNKPYTGGYTFIAPDGKKFTKIEITATTNEGWYTYAYFSQLESGWPAGEAAANDFNSTLKFTWTGSAASANLATTLESFGPSLASSIDFYFEAPAEPVASWVGNSAINANGTWYYAGNNFGWCTGGAFNGADLGTITTLSLGGQSQAWADGNANWNDGNLTMTMGYKIDGGADQSLSLNWFEFADNNNKFQSGGSSWAAQDIDISGLTPGNHTIAVWFTRDDKWDSNNSANYVANFTIPTPAPATYAVSVKEGTLDAVNWVIDPANAASGTEITLKYNGRKKVKNITIEKAAAAAPAEGHPLSASEVGEIVCSDGLAYAAADKDNLPTGVTAVAIVAYVGDAGSVDASSSTYKGLAIAMSNANDGSGCGWGDYFVSYNCVSKSNDIATAIGYKDGISSTITLTSDGHYHEAATAAASNNGTAAPTGTSGWFLPSMGQWNLIVQGLASKKAGSAVTTDISTSGNDTYTASNLNSVITDAGGTGFNGGYQSSTQYDSDDCWHMDISSGRASNYVFYAGDYVRSVLAF